MLNLLQVNNINDEKNHFDDAEDDHRQGRWEKFHLTFVSSIYINDQLSYFLICSSEFTKSPNMFISNVNSKKNIFKSIKKIIN